jgi:hypothetical protein
MDNPTLLIFIIVALVVIVALFWYAKRVSLRKRFGPEYDRAVRDAGSALRAEAELANREKRVSAYHIQPLSPEDGTRFTTAWRQLQARFVDDPAAAVSEADRLVTELMVRRGYPMADFDRRAADLSVDHASVVNHYREAHRIVSAHGDTHRTTTEELRQAVQHYRALFEDLLDISPTRRPA